MNIADKVYVRDESTYNYIAHEHVRAYDMDSCTYFIQLLKKKRRQSQR